MLYLDEVFWSTLTDEEQKNTQSLTTSLIDLLSIFNRSFAQETEKNHQLFDPIISLFSQAQKFPCSLASIKSMLQNNEHGALAQLRKILLDELEATLKDYKSFAPNAVGVAKVRENLRLFVGSFVSTIQKELSYRNQLKTLFPALTQKDEFRTLDTPLEQFYQGKVNSLAFYIGFLSSLQRVSALSSFEGVTDKNTKVYIIKRHEQCTNLSKAFGFASDTDLTAMHPSLLDQNVQTKLHLYASKRIQHFDLTILKLYFGPDKLNVALLSSPVSRATSTALHAVVGPEGVDSVHIDNNFAESKLASRVSYVPSLFASQVSSGTESRTADEIKKSFKDEGYLKVTTSGFTLEDSKKSLTEEREDYQFRVVKATISIRTSLILANVVIVTAHGDINREILRNMLHVDSSISLPKLDYGDSYVVIEKDERPLQVTLESRFGERKHDLLALCSAPTPFAAAAAASSM